MAAGRGRGGSAGNKFRMTLALPVGAVMNCADNSGAKNLYVSRSLVLVVLLKRELTNIPPYRSSLSPVPAPVLTVSLLPPLVVRTLSRLQLQGRAKELTNLRASICSNILIFNNSLDSHNFASTCSPPPLTNSFPSTTTSRFTVMPYPPSTSVSTSLPYT